MKEKKKKAVILFNYAIRRGEIRRQPCSRCGHHKACGHHHDYDKPYNVEWLCYWCHNLKHGKMGLVKKEKKSIRIDAPQWVKDIYEKPGETDG